MQQLLGFRRADAFQHRDGPAGEQALGSIESRLDLFEQAFDQPFQVSRGFSLEQPAQRGHGALADSHDLLASGFPFGEGVVFQFSQQTGQPFGIGRLSRLKMTPQ